MRVTFVTFTAAAAVLSLFATTATAALAPVGIWELNEGTGLTAADSSGNGYHGTLAMSGTNAALPTWGPGVLNFVPSTGNHVATTLPFSLMHGSSWTIEATFTYTGGSGTWRPIIGTSGTTGGYNASRIFFLGRENLSNGRLNINIGGLLAATIPNSASLFDGTQRTLRVEFNDTANTFSFWRDAEPTPFHVSSNITGTMTTTGELWIGSVAHGLPNEVFHGSIDRIVVAVPEPGVISLLGIISLGILRRRR